MRAEIGLDRAPAGDFQLGRAPKHRQILGFKTQRLDDHIGRFVVIGPFDDLGALTARRIGLAKTHFLD